jgi:hypothetical protein
VPPDVVERSYPSVHIANMEREIISRSEALALCLTRYFTGKPCRKGHIAERQASNGNCRECERARGHVYDAANREKRLNYFCAHYAANAEKRRAYARAYYAGNREKIAAASRDKAQRALERARD